ncbi:MAG: glycosyltransferase family 4 protein [Thermodesulfovibrionales bacterium]|nr:glycosyltransferase family 4 protein [Thermodesulfovibrionales bacterium]
MRIGIVSYWFNRGQATVGRYIRSAFDSLGHETFVLARPAPRKFDLPGVVDTTDVWDQPGVTAASDHNIPAREYVQWARDNSIEVAFFDQNYEFSNIRKLRRMGVRTIGRFVWESFAKKHVRPARRAFDVIYSLTGCERVRYHEMGIESPAVSWGCHPELMSFPVERTSTEDGPVRLYYPGGYLSRRKPTRAVLDAFTSVADPGIRLVLKAQSSRNQQDILAEAEERDSRIEVIRKDMPSSDFNRLVSSCHVMLAPSRWEGLGLHLYEAMAFGMPVITNNDPPMNECVHHGINGLLVGSKKAEHTASGLDARDVDPEELAEAIRRIRDPETLEQLGKGARTMAQGFSWERTVQGYQSLISF